MSKQMPAVLLKEQPLKFKGKTIQRRTDGRWWTRYYDKDKKQHSVYGRTQQECLQKLKEALKNTEKKTVEGPLTFGTWKDTWLRLYKEPTLKASTLYQTKRYLGKMQCFFDVPLTDLTPLRLQEFLMSIEAPRNRQHYLDVLRDCLNKAVKNDLLQKNPCDNLQLPKYKSKRSKALTHEEELRFVAACEKDPYGMQFLLCLFQGLRIGETKLLTLQDFDVAKLTLKIDKALNDQYKPDTPKSETSNRMLPLFRRTSEAMEKMPFRMARSDKQVYDHFKSICREANVEGYTVHSLRHTFATRCAEAGIAPSVTQKWMGHSTVDMTLNVYTHVNADFEQKETLKFDTYFDT